jgi:hypothetical protein
MDLQYRAFVESMFLKVVVIAFLGSRTPKIDRKFSRDNAADSDRREGLRL